LFCAGKARFNERIFGAEFYSFVQSITEEPECPKRFVLQTTDSDLEIGYKPTQNLRMVSFRDYNAVYSLTENIIYGALSEKSSQLNGTYEDVISYFLNENSSVDFVLTCVVKDEGDRSSPYLGPFRLSLTLYKGLRFDDIPLDLWDVVRKLEFPVPKLNARNAIHHLRSPRPHDGLRRGGSTMITKDKSL
jgi:hypothetical protein